MDYVLKKIYKKSLIAGLLGMLGLVLVYWLILFLVTRDLKHPVQQFIEYKYWITLLVLGFGIQFGLFWFMRLTKYSAGRTSKSAVATGASTSAFAMVACCAHHLVDLLPLLGLSAAALFLSKYQSFFFLLGIISNIIGIIIMLYIIRSNKIPQLFKREEKYYEFK